jgi:regulator of RNase E activity RraA
MHSATLSIHSVEEICQRYSKLYSGAIADILDKRGFRNQVLPRYLTPLTNVNRVAGLAFTGQGYPCASPADDDTQTRLSMLDRITPGTVSVWACGGSVNCAHWGEMMSTAARQRGCTGAVLDGGVRDLDFINAMQYPVFAAFRSPASSIGRWNIREFEVPVKIGETVIHPGDFVFGDIDGVVIVPQDLMLEVLTAAEDIYRRESGMREELRRGVPVKEAYSKYGSL